MGQLLGSHSDGIPERARSSGRLTQTRTAQISRVHPHLPDRVPSTQQLCTGNWGSTAGKSRPSHARCTARYAVRPLPGRLHGRRRLPAGHPPGRPTGRKEKSPQAGLGSDENRNHRQRHLNRRKTVRWEETDVGRKETDGRCKEHQDGPSTDRLPEPVGSTRPMGY